MSVNYNVIFGNDRREVCASDYSKSISIGYNWYGSDDPRQVRVCPYVTTKYITWKTSESNGLFTTLFYADGQVANMLPVFDVTYQLNNGKKVKVTVKNGIATVNFPSDEYKSTGNQLTIQAVFQKMIMALDDAEVKKILDSQNQNNGNNGNGTGGNGNSGSGGNGNSNSNNGNGNTPGNTGQLNTGNSGGSTGQSESTSSSTSTGSTKLERNSAILDGASAASQSSESQSQASDQQSKTAQEIILDTVNNPNLWSIVALVLLITAIVMVYYRKEIELMYRK